MKTIELPTQAQIKDQLHYDPQTGIFRWRFTKSKKTKPWDIAGCQKKGYFYIGIRKGQYASHRLAWVYMTGEWPKHEVDHIDGVKSNNAWSNLREATHKQNLENLALAKNNTSGFRGVTWFKQTQKWRAMIMHNLKGIHVGYFDTAEEAGQAAAAKRAELFTHNVIR